MVKGLRWERLRVFSCALTLDTDRETIRYVTRLLNPFKQAMRRNTHT